MTKKKANGKELQLAKAGDPLIAPDGSLVEEEEESDLEGHPEHFLPSTPVPYKEYRPHNRAVLSDYRAPTDLLNATAIVLSYTLLGVSDTEIMEATGLRPDQLDTVRNARPYSDMFETIMRSLINANSEYIEARIASYSGMALGNIAHIAETTKNTGYKFAASKDLLDRAGHRPQDRNGGAAASMNELHIIVTESKQSDKFEVNINVGERNGNSS